MEHTDFCKQIHDNIFGSYVSPVDWVASFVIAGTSIHINEPILDVDEYVIVSMSRETQTYITSFGNVIEFNKKQPLDMTKHIISAQQMDLQTIQWLIAPDSTFALIESPRPGLVWLSIWYAVAAGGAGTRDLATIVRACDDKRAQTLNINTIIHTIITWFCYD